MKELGVDRALVEVLTQEIMAKIGREMRGPLLMPATIQSYASGVAVCTVDGDEVGVVVRAANLTGFDLIVGSRVMVQFQPPRAVFVIGTLASHTGRHLIQTQTLVASADSVTFSNIPQIFTNLYLTRLARGTSAHVARDVFLRFNGDAAGNYNDQLIQGQNGTAVAAAAVGATQIRIGPMPAANATANRFGSGDIVIPLYRGAHQKSVVFRYSSIPNNTLADFIAGSGGGSWSTADAITSITFAAESIQFAVGSSFSLYGE